MKQSRFAFLILVAVAFFGTGCKQANNDLDLQNQPVKSGPQYGLDIVQNGKLSYDLYCVSCHGLDGRGDGPVASELITKPFDLTTLSSRYDGVYPSTEVFDYIDGRKNVAAHGTRMMPVWGNIWSEHTGEDVVELRINEIVAYLETIQISD
jgi:mono/diheme cytochrome c family protein